MRSIFKMATIAATAIVLCTPSTAFAQPETVPQPEPSIIEEQPLGPQRDWPGVNVPSDPSNDPDMQPEYFSEEGDAGVSSWSNMHAYIGSWTTHGPYVKLTDMMDFRFTVSMNSIRPMVSWNCSYSPAGDPEYLDHDTHLTLYLIVNGQKAWTTPVDAFRCNGGGSAVIDNPNNWANQDIQVAVRAWTANLDDDYQTVGVKTGTATCDPLPVGQTSGTICRF